MSNMADIKSNNMNQEETAAFAAENHTADEASTTTSTSTVGDPGVEGGPNTNTAPINGDGVTPTTDSSGPPSHRPVRHRATVALTPATPAEGPNSMDIPWSVGTASIDNAKSQKRGVALQSAMTAQGIANFHCGDLVEIEVGVGTARHRLVGRASRPSTAYFWIAELAAAGVALHTPFNLAIVKVHRVTPANSTEVVLTA